MSFSYPWVWRSYGAVAAGTLLFSALLALATSSLPLLIMGLVLTGISAAVAFNAYGQRNKELTAPVLSARELKLERVVLGVMLLLVVPISLWGLMSALGGRYEVAIPIFYAVYLFLVSAITISLGDRLFSRRVDSTET